MIAYMSLVLRQRLCSTRSSVWVACMSLVVSFLYVLALSCFYDLTAQSFVDHACVTQTMHVTYLNTGRPLNPLVNSKAKNAHVTSTQCTSLVQLTRRVA